MKRLAWPLLALLSACATAEPDASLTPVAFDRIPQFSALADPRAVAEFRHECDRFAGLPPDEPLGRPALAGTIAGTLAGRPSDYASACLAARQLLSVTPDTARRFFETWFAAYDAGTATLAGYFEPEFPGSLTRGGAFQTPVLARPSDLVTTRAPDGTVESGRLQDGALVAYPSRAAIDRGALAGRGLELLWLADPVDLYMLQLQGAGRVRLPDGQIVRLAYAGKNGQPYMPIGRLLIERGLLAPADATPAHIRDWLEDNRNRAVPMMEENPDYVFFRVTADVPLDEGAPGALGIPLTPLGSAAVDRDAIPLGTPFLIDAPDTNDPAVGPIRLLVFAQDNSADHDTEIFLGSGDLARRRAALHATGHLIVLLPRPARPVT